MFFTPRYVKEARHYCEAARRVIRYRFDLLTQNQIAEVESGIAALEEATRKRERETVKAQMARLEKVVGRVASTRSHPGWRENCEVFLVAIVIAAGVRAYLLEPFKIPTGSMQPTLNGMIGKVTDSPPPNLLVRAFDFLVRGRTYVNVIGQQDDVVVATEEHNKLNYFTWTDVICASGRRYTIFAPEAVVRSDFHIGPSTPVVKGRPLARGYVDSGDFVLVNKMAYNFAFPQRGDVFVFLTTHIAGIENLPSFPKNMGSQHYIKRLAGLPGDSLRVAAPELFINGEPAKEKSFRRVIAAQNGYRGYENSHYASYLFEPTEPFTVPTHAYFALGDNSYNSLDSRYWGIVPERNIVGKAFIVFWPFSRHWGFID